MIVLWSLRHENQNSKNLRCYQRMASQLFVWVGVELLFFGDQEDARYALDVGSYFCH